MKQMIVATHNADKLHEFRQILDPAEWSLSGLEELGFTGDLPETGHSFAENATQKVTGLAAHYPDAWIVADDSGLCVDLLDGAPGIYSARFLGDASYPEKIAELQKRLRAINEDPETWTGYFFCAMALYRPDTGETLIFEGRLDGRIHTELRGEHGFGYDPVFYLPELGQTAAELPPAEKHARSHRGRALRKLAAWMEAHLAEPGSSVL